MAEKDEKNKSKSWKSYAVVAGVALASMFGFHGDAHAAEAQQQAVSNPTVKLTQQIGQLNLKITQLARNKLVAQRSGNTQLENAIHQEMLKLDMQKKELIVQLKDANQQIQQPQANQQVQNQKEQFNEQLKVKPLMSDEEFMRIANDAKVNHKPLPMNNPEFVRKLQALRHQQAQKAYAERKAKEAQEQQQSR